VSRPSPDRPSRRRQTAQLATDLEAWDLADAEYRKAGLAWDDADSFDPSTHLGGYLDLLNLALVAAGLDRSDVAERLFARVAEALETRRRLMSTENLRRALGADPVNHRIYGHWAQFLAARDRWSDAFDVAEVARARTLTESIAIGRQGDAANEAYQRFRAQAGLVERLTGQLAARYRDFNTLDPAETSGTEAAIRDATETLRQYEVDLLEASPNLRRLQLPRESLATLDETVRLIPPRVLLLAFHVYHRHILAWAVDNSGLVGHTRVREFAGKPFDAWLFATRARAWVHGLSTNRTDADLESELAVTLLGPFDSLLRDHSHVVVVPHRELSILPMHALPWNEAPLGRQRSVSYLPAATMLKLFEDVPATDPAVVVGDPANMRWLDPVSRSPRDVAPLPAAGLEAAAIAQLYEVRALIGADATESAVRSALKKAPRTIHFATHGVFEPSSVFDSGIALADGESLTLDEIGALNLRGTLVVMSACDTGRAAAQGPELVGVVRGLLAAGARAALVSLWAAPDVATLLFMQDFHRQVAQGLSPGAALRESQKWLAECTADQALTTIAALPQRADAHAARVAMCNAEIRGLASDYRGALSAIEEAEREWERAGITVHTGDLTRARYRYTILSNSADAPPDLERRVFSSPFFWAPFALFGDWR
jgi:CHAT domain-containing protein